MMRNHNNAINSNYIKKVKQKKLETTLLKKKNNTE